MALEEQQLRAAELLLEVVPQDKRGAAYGLTSMASAGAGAVGPLSGAAIASQLGQRAVFLTTGTLFTLACGWAMLGLRKGRAHVALLEADRLDA